jgi:D-sedoheptulose 7-phosphate isomerase
MPLNNLESRNSFFQNYNLDLKNLISFDKGTINKIIKITSELKRIKKKNKKVIIFGNGGSAAIANHFTIDLTKVCNIRCVNFNESSLLTCFSNDYGYENWVKKALEFYLDKEDLVIFISSSGKSKNIINGCGYAKKKNSFVVTLTGFNNNNPLNRLGDINFWVNSKKYNMVENVHQIFLLSIVDYIASQK